MVCHHILHKNLHCYSSKSGQTLPVQRYDFELRMIPTIFAKSGSQTSSLFQQHPRSCLLAQTVPNPSCKNHDYLSTTFPTYLAMFPNGTAYAKYFIVCT